MLPKHSRKPSKYFKQAFKMQDKYAAFRMFDLKAEDVSETFEKNRHSEML